MVLSLSLTSVECGHARGIKNIRLIFTKKTTKWMKILLVMYEEQSEQHDDDQPDGEQHDVERKAIEEAILSIIGKIKKDRNRACVQNIHTFVNRRGFDIGADIVEKIIDDLISNNMIENKGRNGKESFFYCKHAIE